MEEVQVSAVYRNLDSKLKILGLEALDLIVVLLFASVMNLIFGKTALAPVMIFLVPGIMLALLYVGKKNRPDDFLKHYMRYYLESGHFSANQKSIEHDKLLEKIHE